MGYKNVHVYAAGFPDFKKKAPYYSIGVETVKAKMAKGEDYLLIDARPTKKFLGGSIPSAISIPDSKFAKKEGLLPASKDTQLIYFCGGFKCPLSHKSANKAKALGYKNIVTAEAGYPGWKKLYGGAKAVAVKSGGAEGSIDVVQFTTLLKSDPSSMMIIDVRDPAEYKAGHFPGAVNIPVDTLEAKIKSLPSDKPIVFVCATGARSGEALYMVMDVRPELKKVYYLEAECTYNPDGSYKIKPNK